MARIAGRIYDRTTREQVEARVHVLSSGGAFLHPADALLKVGTGLPFFYCDGEFTVDAPRGQVEILVERGTEYRPTRRSLYAPAGGVDDGRHRAGSAGPAWASRAGTPATPTSTTTRKRAGRTNGCASTRASKTCASRPSASSNAGTCPMPATSYPPGMLTDFCSAHHYVECGEENRHNGPNDSDREGYGHIMLLRIKDVVEPVSRGYLIDETDPDYPPLCYACDDAHRQGGIVIWCHNGNGLEAPVAAALGKLDAFNLFDPYWMDPEYDVWYAMLNCGFRLPASTGSDWFICSANRVYAHTGRPFEHEDWIDALKQGRTFITNGPALFLTVSGRLPGDTVRVNPGDIVGVSVAWQSHYPVDRIEIIHNGRVIAGRQMGADARNGQVQIETPVATDGWIAARLSSQVRDSFFQPIYAHTSPVYISTGRPASEQLVAAGGFARAIDAALELVQRQGKFRSDGQRKEVVDLFREGQAVYERMVRDG